MITFRITGSIDFPQYLKFRNMDKVHKPSDSEGKNCRIRENFGDIFLICHATNA
jgi:hypothetical protein